MTGACPSSPSRCVLRLHWMCPHNLIILAVTIETNRTIVKTPLPTSDTSSVPGKPSCVHHVTKAKDWSIHAYCKQMKHRHWEGLSLVHWPFVGEWPGNLPRFKLHTDMKLRRLQLCPYKPWILDNACDIWLYIRDCWYCVRALLLPGRLVTG